MSSILVVLSALLTIASGSINYYNIDMNQGRADVSCAFQSPLPNVRDADLNLDGNMRFLNWLNKLRMQVASNKELCVASEPQAAANETKNSPWDKYADIKSCKGHPHTGWVYRTKDPAPACHEVIKFGLTAMEKRRILDLHNELRQKVARGEETRGNPGPQPPAHNMRIMKWDDELAELAQRWANQCNFATDQCRNVERFKVNQAMSITTYNKNDIIKTTAEDLVRNSYSSVDTIDGRDISNYKFKEHQIRYAYIVAADTYKLGCGAIIHPVPAGKRFTLVCNYGPWYNTSQPVYKIF